MNDSFRGQIRHVRASTAMGYQAAIIVALAIAGMAVAESAPDYSSLVRRGNSALEAGRYNEALTHYFGAHAAGMPKDSLLYLWCDIYVQRQIYDSALAINGTALESAEDETRRVLLKQRYAIFRLAGAENQAEKVLEELARDSDADTEQRRFVPHARVRLLGGYGSVREATPASFLHIDSAALTMQSSPEWRARTAGTGGFRLHAERGPPLAFEVSAGMGTRRYAATEQPAGIFDSLEWQIGAGMAVEELFDILRVGLEGGMSRDKYDHRRPLCGASSSLIFPRRSLVVFGNYQVAFRKGTVDYAMGFFRGEREIRLSPRLTLSPGVSAMLFDGPPVDMTLGQVGVTHVDASSAHGETVPQWYTDQSMKQPIDTAGVNGTGILSTVAIRRYADGIIGSADMLDLEVSFPVGFRRLALSFSGEINAGAPLLFILGLHLRGDWYISPYRWVRIDPEVLSGYVAYDPREDAYYEITGLDPDGSIDRSERFGIGNQALASRKDERRDAAVELTMRFEWTTHRAGRVDMVLATTRNFTTLDPSCPLEIPRWDLRGTLGWNLRWSRKEQP